MADKFRRASKLLNRFLKLTLGSYLRLLFGFKIINDQISGLKPPYIVLANHTNFWDPFLLSMCVPDPVYFVTSDAHFRNPVLRWLLKLVGAIPKTKFVSDPQSIKDIIKVARNGGIIGIFPEGRRSWDGKTLPLLYPTAKLIKLLGLPVVAILFKGACLSLPRWAKHPRKGELLMVCSRIMDADAAGRLSAGEIFELASASLEHDEYEYQKGRMIPYKANLPAEKLELFLFCCPNCRSIGALKSKNEDFSCSKCSYSVKYDKYGFFSSHGAVLYYDNPKDWNLWQLQYLSTLPAAAGGKNPDAPVFEDSDILLQTGGRRKPLKKLHDGKLMMFFDKIIFQGGDSIVLQFPLGGIYGENIQLNNLLEFYHEKTLYRFTGNSYDLSAYKWVKAIELFKQTQQTGG